MSMYIDPASDEQWLGSNWREGGGGGGADEPPRGGWGSNAGWGFDPGSVPLPGQGYSADQTGDNYGGGGGGGGGGQKPGGPSAGWGGANPSFNPQGGFWGFNPGITAGLGIPEQAGLAGIMGMGEAGAPQYNQAYRGLRDMMQGGVNPYMDQAGLGAQYMMTSGIGPYGQKAMDLYGMMPDIGARQVTGENVASDPAFLAALEAFDTGIAPTIQDKAGLMGLGRSQPALSAMANAKANYIQPQIMASLQREERGIDRELGATSGAAGGFMGGAGMGQQRELAGMGQMAQLGGQFAGNQLAGIQGMAGLGDTQQRNVINQINQMMGAGSLPRQLEQDQYDRMQSEWSRLMSGYENAISAPLGLTPDFIGGIASQAGKK